MGQSVVVEVTNSVTYLVVELWTVRSAVEETSPPSSPTVPAVALASADEAAAEAV